MLHTLILGNFTKTTQSNGKRPPVAQEDFWCPWDGKPRLAKEMTFLGDGSSILLANQLDLGRLGEKSNFQVSGLGNWVNVGPFAKMITTGSGRRDLDWTCWVHSSQGTSHQGTSRKHMYQGVQWASIILKQSAHKTGMVIKHWNECADLRVRVCEWAEGCC